VSICTEINLEITVDSKRHFAVGGALVSGELAIQGRSDTIVETLRRDFNIQAESYVSSSSKISRRPTRLLTCEVKQEQSFRASEYWYLGVHRSWVPHCLLSLMPAWLVLDATLGTTKMQNHLAPPIPASGKWGNNVDLP
jgi:hypothetical protein